MSTRLLLATTFLVLFFPAYLAFSNDICPPPILLTPCVCSKFGENVSAKCENITRNDVILNVMRETSEYSYGYIHLIDSSMQNFPASAFQVKKIVGLIMHRTSLTSLFDEPPKAEDLQEIQGHEMKILRTVKWEYFYGMTNLKVFNFSFTHLTTMDENFKKYFPESLEILNLDTCSINKLPDKAFEAMINLVVITINNGKIKELKRNMFPSPSALRVLSFKNQRIESLPDDIFKSMPYLQGVNLENNHISQIRKIRMELNPFRWAFYLNVKGNPIKCNCSFRWILDKTVVPTNVVMGECAEPKNLYGTKIEDLTEHHFEHCTTTHTV